ncbi:hypothetical protein KQ247_14250 [Ruegeria pomeroyi]|uniref:Lipoprotein, putative n=2 Tax=Ruegeria pomeroyi TaxID=89184 RepID=Q5LUF2_RUEPO|nr:hypothetical protein [Ruegeria pomeroyi]HCE71415.1 hypothetical protein [Ruegeria sp.]AAV94402.1 lipoprotein, putative [Ruegeria pomeroyi DSS-3]NVK97250.1 hypothetical protein [Ruegeria pomeroyi]NVL04148.1 hypothetical protein [Ruegeria pomeroyi]QWV07984.1 hypothetical protein KQ247_14250 [Ruegeria pomeroyi]
MFGARTYPRASRPLAVLALIGLAACALDREAEVRAQLGGWMPLGDTLYFESKLECTAGVFATPADILQTKVRTVSTLRDGLAALSREAIVAFDLEGETPDQVSQAVMSADLPKGLGILASGLSARACMDEATKSAYLSALHSPAALLIFAPDNNALVILDRDRRQVFFARGDV